MLESAYGELGLRDPFLIRSPEGDRFFLIATDLSIGRNGDWDRSQRQGSRYLEIWESTDLMNWSEQRHVLVSPPTAGNTWAPEAYWDEDLQQYVVFWASKLYAENDPGHTGNTYNKMLYATTRDFVTFSEARIWQDVGVLAHRLDRDQGGRHLLPLHQGRGRRQHRLLRHHPGEERQPDRARPRRRPGLGVPGRLHRSRRRHLGRRGPDRLQAQPR